MKLAFNVVILPLMLTLVACGNSTDMSQASPHLVSDINTPLVLDLNSNGLIDIVPIAKSTAYFDFNYDDIAERSAWVAPDDGFLVIDKNGNNVIDNLSELFINQVDMRSSLLKHYDSNADNVIDARDPVFTKLRIWREAFRVDGVAQKTELSNLDQLGIVSLGLNVTSSSITAGDSQVTETSSFVRNGKKQLMGYVSFKTNLGLTDSNPVRAFGEMPVFDSEVYDLPWLRGYGVVKNLNYAMQKDMQLRQSAIKLAGQKRTEIINHFDDFIAQWSGLTAAHSAKGVQHPSLTVEDKVWIMESFVGQDYQKTMIEKSGFESGVVEIDKNYVEVNFQHFLDREAFFFAIEATAKNWTKGMSYSFTLDKLLPFGWYQSNNKYMSDEVVKNIASITNEDDAKFFSAILARFKVDNESYENIDLTELKQRLALTDFSSIYQTALGFTGDTVAVLAENPSSPWLSGSGQHGEFNVGTYIIGSKGNDFTNGSSSADVFYGGDGNDVFHGLDGDDILIGDAGNDVLDGGKGNDLLVGADGSDTYIFGIGGGKDTINNEDTDLFGTNADVILLGTGITSKNIKFSRTRDDLTISINGTNDTLSIFNYFDKDANSAYTIENIRFVDNAFLNVVTVKAGAITSTSGNDNIIGYESNDIISGGTGNDRLEGRGGGDVLDGGDGDDFENGGNGADIYIFGLGSGKDIINNYDVDVLGANADTVLLGAGITFKDIMLKRDGDNLIISINNTEDSLIVENYFYRDASTAYAIENIKFVNNTIWKIETVKNRTINYGVSNLSKHDKPSDRLH